MRKFINLSAEERKAMGVAGREQILKEFDEKIIINIYIEKILEL